MEEDNISFHEEEGTVEDHEYYDDFIEAINENDEEQINILIRKKGILWKYFPFDDDEDAGSFIALAAKRGTIKTVSEMCKLVPSVINVESHLNRTPLYFAMKNSIEMVNFFIKQGADVNARNMNDETPLHYAMRDSAEIVKILLKNGANVDVTGIHSVPLIHDALLNGTEETLRLILNKRLSEIKKKYKEVKTSEEIVRELLLNKDILKIVKKDIPLLIFFAAKIGKNNVFKIMLREIRKHFDLVQDNTKNSCGELNIGGYYNRTALHYATRQQLPEVVRFLLTAGADVNCKTRTNFTPLHYAASLQNEDICKILVDFKADLNYTFADLGSPLYQVCGYDSVNFPLEEYDGYYYEESYRAPLCGRRFNLKIIKLLLENGANPNVPANEGNTPFLEACVGGELETLKILFEFGVDLQVYNEDGDSALHLAVLGNSLENVNFLLEKGINIDVKNYHDLTPLLRLMRQCRPRHLEMIEYLVNHGADINDGGIFMVTPLHMASIVFDSIELVEGLLALGANWIIEHQAELSSKPNFGSGRKLLMSFIALKDRKIGQYIFCYFEDQVAEFEEAIEFFKKSLLEVEKLKSTKIVQESSVSFYDFLTGSVYNTVQVVKNQKIKEVFKSRKYFKDFPCYWFLIHKRFERIINSTDAVDKMAEFFTKSLSPMPMLVTRKLLNSLDTFDFQNWDTNLSESNSPDEQEMHLNLYLNIRYDSKIVEIRETGVMVTLLKYPKMQPALLLYSQMKTDSVPNPKAPTFKVGRKIEVVYVGRYPKTGKIRLTGKI